MTFASYIRKNFPTVTYAEFEEMERKLHDDAKRIYEHAKTLHDARWGMYYDISELGLDEFEPGIIPHIVKALKDLGMEFYEETQLYRV